MIYSVVGIRLKKAGKMYYFDPGDLDLNLGEKVIVETSKGLEMGTVCTERKEIDEEEIISPLKPVVRIATDKDLSCLLTNIEKKKKALEVCEEAIKRNGLDMKLVDVEYAFDNNIITFYFTSDGRVDFRELVKDLAGCFRVRIELRQIGVRDEAKMLGGVGNCGRPLCCYQWLSDFQPVSIKMAKNQGLSLNPTKISGICGRLMCCLKYENEVYQTQKKGMPDVGEYVTFEGDSYYVLDSNILEEKIQARRVLERGNHKDGDKLDDEMLTLGKGQFKRQYGNFKKKEEELPDEIKKLLDE